MSKKIDFIGIGGMKCGSTWLAECMREHPDILFPKKKELQFFNTPEWGGLHKNYVSNYENGIEWYLNQFPEKSEKNQVVGEFSTSYLIDPIASKRISETFPDVKVIAVLRNPIKSVYSLYNFLRSSVRQIVPDTFEETVQQNHPVLATGLYSKHINKCLKYFVKEQMHVVILDEMQKNKRKTIQKLFSFLNVDTNFYPKSLDKRLNKSFAPKSQEVKKLAKNVLAIAEKTLPRKLYNKLFLDNKKLYLLYKRANIKPQEYTEMDSNVKAQLQNYYKKDVEVLSSILEKDLTYWLS